MNITDLSQYREAKARTENMRSDEPNLDVPLPFELKAWSDDMPFEDFEALSQAAKYLACGEALNTDEYSFPLTQKDKRKLRAIVYREMEQAAAIDSVDFKPQP